MTGTQILLLIVALVVLAMALLAVWRRRQRAGGVRIASGPPATGNREDQP